MGWSIGYDHVHQRDVGYGVPAYCDHPGCKAEIDRGLVFICGGAPGGGDDGCGLFFCNDHLLLATRKPGQRCERCWNERPAFKPSPDHPKWIEHQLTHDSWANWRAENTELVEKMRASLEAVP